ncbi:E3 SUMO-protein ligase NSE2 isoform X2 [Acanthochromis polyacanthus]|uniref:E3 SUMO-protein ligase NSE2 isoform X2 n=1 Tax=Acanthochromis polyacanthus TaxID=80966 RepID=UPI0022344D9E|nr:E3 SUMO-protein ligase NSE2 isoform X2 [Acanthochromis polyacanthus]
MSLSAVHGTLSSLKSCQTDIGTGMDIVTDVAMDLAEAQDDAVNPGIKAMEDMILECAKLDREINYFVDVVQQVTAEVTTQQPEAMFSLSDKVKEQYTERIARLSDADLHNHQKVVAFKDSIRNSFKQASQESAADMEELDEDVAVTQTQVNFTCPLTQLSGGWLWERRCQRLGPHSRPDAEEEDPEPEEAEQPHLVQHIFMNHSFQLFIKPMPWR